MAKVFSQSADPLVIWDFVEHKKSKSITERGLLFGLSAQCVIDLGTFLFAWQLAEFVAVPGFERAVSKLCTGRVIRPLFVLGLRTCPGCRP